MTGNYNSNTKPELTDIKYKMESMEQHFEGLYVQKNELMAIDRRFNTQDEINTEYDDNFTQVNATI